MTHDTNVQITSNKTSEIMQVLVVEKSSDTSRSEGNGVYEFIVTCDLSRMNSQSKREEGRNNEMKSGNRGRKRRSTL